MIIVNIHEAKTHFSKLLDQALNGEEVIITRGGKPIIRLSPYVEKEIPSRKGGQLKGMIHIAEDFDAPLPPEILNDLVFITKDEKIADYPIITLKG